jgi:hypothetical protein
VPIVDRDENPSSHAPDRVGPGTVSFPAYLRPRSGLRFVQRPPASQPALVIWPRRVSEAFRTGLGFDVHEAGHSRLVDLDDVHREVVEPLVRDHEDVDQPVGQSIGPPDRTRQLVWSGGQVDAGQL